MVSTATDRRCAARLRPAVAACVVLAAFCSGSAPGALAQDGVAADRTALEALYDATNGSAWTDSTNWKTDAPLNEWHGVWTGDDGRVVGIELVENGLSGPLPSSLGRLSGLEALALAHNELSGPLPSSLGDLSRLRELFLNENGLSGPLPSSLGRLSSLEWLALESNELSGPLPSSLGDLSNLKGLSLNRNALSGPLPPSLGRLSSLEWLALAHNELSGPLPSSLGDLSRLRELYLVENGLSGPLPPSLGRLSSLESLDLAENRLSGPIPSSLGDLSNLIYLRLNWNGLSGPLPSSLGRLSSLEWLELLGNGLSGPIPSSLGNLSSLKWLDLAENALAGPLPPALGSLSSLEWLSLRSNVELSGPLPGTLTGLSRLTELDASGTGLCAPHDAAFQAWLATLWFSGEACNRAPEPVGTIPTQTLAAGGAARRLPVAGYFRDPDDDVLTYAATSSDGDTVAVYVAAETAQSESAPHGGPSSPSVVWLVPGTAGTATVTVTARDPDGLDAVQTVAVTVVESTGPQTERAILEALYDATGGADWTDSTNWKTDAPLHEWHGVATGADGRVTELSLTGNGLSGPIPASLGNLSNLLWLNLRGNELSGPIPSSLGNLSNLIGLMLDRNALSGPIPSSLGNLSNLQWLVLRGKLNEFFLPSGELSGPIPSSLGNLSNLERLDLGSNALSGPIPSSLGNLSNLKLLDLSRNELSGPIPSSLGNLSNLELLNLDGYPLSGPVPSFLNNLSSLIVLSLASSELSGPIPSSLGNLSNLESLNLGGNELSGPIPSSLGNLSNLINLSLGNNALSGPIPSSLGSLSNLGWLYLSGNWGLTGPLPAGLRNAPLRTLGVWLTQACAPREWGPWLASMDAFEGALCGTGPDATVDVAVVYTPAAREAAGGVAEIEAVIDLMVAETNQAYSASDVRHRLALVGREEVPYTEVNDHVDLARLADPSDGHLDGAHALRDRTGADLVHMIFDTGGASYAAGIAFLGGAFGLTSYNGGGAIFAHELGHNMGLRHDRYQVHHYEGQVRSHPAYGYVNQRAFETGAPRSSRWRTVMSYGSQCEATASRGVCTELLRFSNPRQDYNGDPLGTPFGSGGSGVAGPADAAAVLAVTGPAVAAWRDRPGDGTSNRAPTAVGTLPDQNMAMGGVLHVDVSAAFADPDGDELTYAVSSSAPQVATVLAAGSRVTLTAVAEGTSVVTVTATDPGGLSAVQSFTVTVSPAPNRSPEAVGVLGPLTLGFDDPASSVEVAGAFRDPDGDELTYGAVSSAPSVASVSVSGSVVAVTPAGEGTAVVTVTATDPGGLSAAQSFTVTVSGPSNRAPEAVGVLGPLTLGFDDPASSVDVGGAFRDPDGDELTYGAVSSAPSVASVSVSGSVVAVTPAGAGTAVVTVTATDTAGSNTAATQTFSVRVVRPFTDHPIVPGVTAVRAVHFTELRARIDVLRREAGLAPFNWTDPVLLAGLTPVRLVHLTELRSALDAVYDAAGRPRPAYADANTAAGALSIKAAHIMELRAAVLGVE